METILKQFNNYSELINYVTTTEINKKLIIKDIYKTVRYDESASELEFTKVQNFQEAINLLQCGWEVKAKELTSKLKQTYKTEKVNTKLNYDVVGFSASVPRYLQGIPTNMINKKEIPKKNKIINLYKSIGYTGRVNANDIVKESLKALSIVLKLEEMGYRVNLYAISDSEASYGVRTRMIFILKIKSSSQKLNIAKVAFPLVHPAMMRKFVFAWRERDPRIRNKDLITICGYGLTNETNKTREFVHTELNGSYIPNFIDDVELEIKKILENIK